MHGCREFHNMREYCCTQVSINRKRNKRKTTPLPTLLQGFERVVTLPLGCEPDIMRASVKEFASWKANVDRLSPATPTLNLYRTLRVFRLFGSSTHSHTPIPLSFPPSSSDCHSTPTGISCWLSWTLAYRSVTAHGVSHYKSGIQTVTHSKHLTEKRRAGSRMQSHIFCRHATRSSRTCSQTFHMISYRNNTRDEGNVLGGVLHKSDKRKKGGTTTKKWEAQKKGIKIETDTAARIKTTFYQMKIDDRAQPSDVPWEMVTHFNTFFSPPFFSFLPPRSNGV